MFTKGHPVEPDASGSLDAHDPIEPTSLVIDIDQIECYTHNPRRAPNPAFDAIKASIRVDGLHQPLVITRRPRAERYMVLRGGNTRLRALQELVRESGDSRFRKIHCLFEPWAGESVALLGHLIENDTRGELTFLDRARAIEALKACLEQDEQTELSQRRLAALLKARGYRISAILISQMAYARTELAPVLPQAFQAGLGGDRVQRIRTLDRAGEALWRRRALGTSEAYRILFREALARGDGPDWRFERAQADLAKQLAECARIATHRVQAELESEPANDASPASTLAITSTPSEPTENLPPPNQATTNPRCTQTNTETGHQTMLYSNPDEQTAPATGPMPLRPDAETAETPPSAYEVPDDIKSLRARAWTLATKLARRDGLDDLIRALPSTGLGYAVIDVIKPDRLAQYDKLKAGEIATLWWQLVACAELTSAPLQDLQSILRPDGLLLQALRAHDLASLLEAVPTYHLSELAAALWSRMCDRDWHDLLALMDNYRRLRAVAARERIPLWSDEGAA